MNKNHTSATSNQPAKRSLRFGSNSEKSASKLKILTASIVAALYPVTPALAQDAETNEGVLEEVLVTATKRELNMQSVPQSIQTFSNEQIIRAN